MPHVRGFIDLCKCQDKQKTELTPQKRASFVRMTFD